MPRTSKRLRIFTIASQETSDGMDWPLGNVARPAESSAEWRRGWSWLRLGRTRRRIRNFGRWSLEEQFARHVLNLLGSGEVQNLSHPESQRRRRILCDRHGDDPQRLLLARA